MVISDTNNFSKNKTAEQNNIKKHGILQYSVL